MSISIYQMGSDVCSCRFAEKMNFVSLLFNAVVYLKDCEVLIMYIFSEIFSLNLIFISQVC